MYRKLTVVCCEIHRNQRNTFGGQIAYLLNVQNLAVQKVKTEAEKVNNGPTLNM
jgi:hypothetical protein